MNTPFIVLMVLCVLDWLLYFRERWMVHTLSNLLNRLCDWIERKDGK